MDRVIDISNEEIENEIKKINQFTCLIHYLSLEICVRASLDLLELLINTNCCKHKPLILCVQRNWSNNLTKNEAFIKIFEYFHLVNLNQHHESKVRDAIYEFFKTHKSK